MLYVVADHQMLQELSSNYKPLHDISFLHIMFCCQFSFMPYAKYTKKWVLFFGIVKPGNVLEPRGVFPFQIVSWERDVKTRLTLYWNAFVIFCEVWMADSARWDKEDASTVDKENGFWVDKGVEQDRLRSAISLDISSLNCVLFDFQKTFPKSWSSQR